MIKVRGLSKSYPSKIILHDINFDLNPNDKVGLVGINGVGKSTLLKILAGKETYDEGEIDKKPNINIGYLPQEVKFHDLERTIEEFVYDFVGIKKLADEMAALEKDLEKEANLQRYAEVQEQFLALDGYNFDYKLDYVLNGLGFDAQKRKVKLKEISGGEKSKVLLGGVLLKGADLLLLDEPTNNLDLRSIVWLEEYILSLDVPMILISHDQKLLDKVVNKVFELDYFAHDLTQYTGNYSSYVQQKEKNLLKKMQAYEQQQEEINNIEQSLQQKKQWANMGQRQTMKDKDKYTRGYERDRSSSLASQAKKMEKKLAKMEKVEKPRIKEPPTIEIKESTDKQNANIFANELVCGYGDEFHTEPLSFQCDFGTRLLVLGENGVGKTALIKTIVGELEPIDGDLTVYSSVKMGYLAQESMTDDERTVMDYLDDETTVAKEARYNALQKFNFTPEEINKKLTNLSPGERTRLRFVVFMLNEINTLVLDEPTNHLDFEAIEILTGVLEKFQGTVIAVSHDRQFIEDLQPDEVIRMQKKEKKKR